MATAAPGADWLATHRAAWARKPGLRAVYERWFADLRAACTSDGPIVELGCGPGFFKQRYPDVLATDLVPNPFADCIVAAEALPFADAEVASLVLLDVFHHLREPAAFLREAARILRPGGRLVVLEPWTGLAGRLLYRWMHHEDCDAGVDPHAPWRGGDKDPMHGNVALPALYFRPGGHLESLDLPLRVIRREPFAALPWLLSGGFQAFGLLPTAMVRPAEAVDRALSRLPALMATRCFLVAERDTLRHG